MEFLTWFNLNHLELDSVREFPVSLPVDPYRVSYVPVPSRPLQVRNLNFLNGDAVYQEAEIIARVLGSANNLHSVTYRLQTSKDVYALGRLLRSSGKGVTTLSLPCCPNVGRGPCKHLNLLSAYTVPNAHMTVQRQSSSPTGTNSISHTAQISRQYLCRISGPTHFTFLLYLISSLAMRRLYAL